MTATYDELVGEVERLRAELATVRGSELDRQAEREFWQTVTHELNTPMQALWGYAVMIQPDLPLDEFERFRGAIIREVNRLSGVVTELHQQVDIDTGNVHIHAEATALPGLIDACAEELEKVAPDRIVTRDYDEARLPLVRTDRAWTQYILNNLLRNAARYSPEDAEIVIRVEPRSPSPGQATIMVIDSGPGIPADFQKTIFDRYVRLPTPKAKNRWGLGLGLYVARRVARDLQGDVVLVRSEPGAGSTFGLVLPVATE